MRLPIMIVVVSFTLLCSALIRADEAAPNGSRSKGGITLLGSLEEWKYPGSKMPQGATMTGNGPYPPMQFVICRTVLTTPDSMEKVVDFYTKKFGIADKVGKAESRTADGEAQATFVQDDSKGRPVGVCVFTVVRAKSSTTSLAISRAEGEKETHIVWMHFIHIGEAK
jgi:hypothetical protein